MRAETKRRLALYLPGLAILLVLGYVAFCYSVNADPIQLVRQAEILATAGMYDEAIADAELALKQAPSLRYAHLILASCYRGKMQYDRAIAQYEAALELTANSDPKRDRLRLHHAELLQLSGRNEDAIRECRSVQKTSPDDHQAWYVIGRAHAALGQSEEALSAFEMARDALPEDPEPLLLMAEVERKRGDAEKALDLLDAALDLAPEIPEIRLHRGRAFMIAGNSESAVEELLILAEKKRVVMKNAVLSEEIFAPIREDERLRAEFPPRAPAKKTPK